MAVALLAIALLFGAAPEASPQTPTEKPKRICRDTQQQTGSHIRTGRRCKTAEQWLKYDADLDGIPPTMRITKGQEDGRPVQNPQ
jgi:hypothetical protein